MQILNRKKQVNKKLNKIKKSHLLIFGSLLVFVGVFALSYNHLKELRDRLFSDMLIAMYNMDIDTVDTPIADNKGSDGTVYKEENIDYNKYLGVLTIPKIGLKRGFHNVSSKYNNIEYNVTLVLGSTMPDVPTGNLMLMAHSGDAYISYFAYLYRLRKGDIATITYRGRDYNYKLVDVYDVAKTGKVEIRRNYNKTTLTLITCTKNDSTKQTVYIFELT